MKKHPDFLSINKVHFPVTTLGFGRRVGIWTQGCSIRCPGCVSQDTWAIRPDCNISVTELLKGIIPWLKQADGLTISGGEPFDQPGALLSFLRKVRATFTGDILMYSGYSLARLVADFPAVIQSIDVLISEPYDQRAPQTRIWRGSDNQIITVLTPLARHRYPAEINERCWSGPRQFDVMNSGEGVWLVGIPKKNGIPELKAQLRSRGFDCKSSQHMGVLA